MDYDGYDDLPPTVDALADLQAGLVDDDIAAHLRKKVRTDPGAQNTMRALNRVRREVAALGTDPSSAPDVDPAAVDRIRATLRKQHAVHRGGLPAQLGWRSRQPDWWRSPSRSGWAPER